MDDVRFCNWLVYTRISGGGGLCKICVLMQAHLHGTWNSRKKHGTLENAAFQHFGNSHPTANWLAVKRSLNNQPAALESGSLVFFMMLYII